MYLLDRGSLPEGAEPLAESVVSVWLPTAYEQRLDVALEPADVQVEVTASTFDNPPSLYRPAALGNPVDFVGDEPVFRSGPGYVRLVGDDGAISVNSASDAALAMLLHLRVSSHPVAPRPPSPAPIPAPGDRFAVMHGHLDEDEWALESADSDASIWLRWNGETVGGREINDVDRAEVKVVIVGVPGGTILAGAVAHDLEAATVLGDETTAATIGTLPAGGSIFAAAVPPCAYGDRLELTSAEGGQPIVATLPEAIPEGLIGVYGLDLVLAASDG